MPCTSSGRAYVVADLKVDLGELAQSADELAALIEEFENSDDITHSEDIGSSLVMGALHEFATNWKAHREDLVKEMKAVHTMVEKSHAGFLDTDSRLAKDIADAIGKKTQGHSPSAGVPGNGR